MSVFFTSDTHYFHSNIIQFTKRPYGSLVEMHAAFIANWNEVVQQDDEVFHLGDVSFGSRGMTLGILNALKGRIRFIPGNHDKKSWLRDGRDDLLLPPLFERTFQWGAYTQKIVLCHFPLLTWNKASHGSWMLHGHSHGSLDERNKKTRRLDVGVDGIASMYPLKLELIAEIMKDREYEVVDSHGARSENKTKP